MIKSPFGIVLTAAAVLLALSPEARKAARSLAVKGTGAMLDLKDQIQDRASGLQSAFPGCKEPLKKSTENPDNVL